jgi:RNA polymerase sigma-70 factor
MAISSPASLDRAQLERLYERAQASRWTLSRAAFAAAIEASVQKGLADRARDRAAVDAYLASLHVEDLALACACAEGHEPAWEHVMREHRAALGRAAEAIDGSGGGRELADSLFADLFGLAGAEGTRRSLLRYFHGRSSLATWLRAVLAQRHVDRIRASRRTAPLPDDDAALPDRRAGADPEAARQTQLMRGAMQAAVEALAPRDRLRLNCYYAQELTLAEIGRLLGEHEATVSRHLARTRRSLRDAVDRHLADRHQLDAPAIRQCWQVVMQDSGSLDLREWLHDPPVRKIDAPERSKT